MPLNAIRSENDMIHSDVFCESSEKYNRRDMITSISVWIVSLTILGLISLYHWRRRHLYAAARKYHGATAWPLVGNALHFTGGPTEFLREIDTYVAKYKSPCRFWFGPSLVLCFKNPEHIEKILNSSKFTHKHEIYDFLKVVAGEGLITASGIDYKRHRKMFQPLFNLNFCKQNVAVLQKHTDILLENLENFVGTKHFDIRYLVQHCFSDMIGETFLGVSIDAQNGKNLEVLQAFSDLYDLAIRRIMKVWLHPDFIYKWTADKSKERYSMRIIRGFFSGAITESWKRRKILGNTECRSIVDQMAQIIEKDPGKISSEDFVSHMITFYLASEDTMTLTISFLCVCLGLYPQYQKKAAEEIRNIFGTVPRPVTYEDISKVSYLDACIKETLRLFPIAPFILRSVPENAQIDIYDVPKDSGILIPIYNLHRDPKYWEKPQEFYPDHFLTEQVNKRPVYAYLPFSGGVRNCIGKIVANVALKLVICNLLQRYEIQAEGSLSDLILKTDISVRSVNGYMVKLNKRNWD